MRSQECPRAVDAGKDRSCRAGCVGRVEAPIKAVTVEALRPGDRDRRLAVGGKGLVCADDHRVGTLGEGMARQASVEPKVGAPRLIYDDGHVSLVGRPDQGWQVGEPTEVAGL